MTVPKNMDRTSHKMTNTILIIEDDKSLAGGLKRALASKQCSVETCPGLHTAKEKLRHNNYALILLDINLPDGNGFDFLIEIKEEYDTPVIMLTANDLESDIVSALEQGADDYITKPFSLAILRARVQAQLRRGQANAHPALAHTSDRYAIDGYRFDFDKMEFSRDGILIELSKTEQKLLHILVRNAGITLSREHLSNFVWTDGTQYVDENALSVAIKRLRDKLAAQDYIRTVYGIGYVWKEK